MTTRNGCAVEMLGYWSVFAPLGRGCRSPTASLARFAALRSKASDVEAVVDVARSKLLQAEKQRFTSGAHRI